MGLRCVLGIIDAVRPLRSFKTNRCHLTDRIVNCELCATLGIASVNFFTARYLTPLAKDGYIAGGEGSRYRSDKQYSLL